MRRRRKYHWKKNRQIFSQSAAHSSQVLLFLLEDKEFIYMENTYTGKFSVMDSLQKIPLQFDLYYSWGFSYVKTVE